jgi:hypothetical protein
MSSWLLLFCIFLVWILWAIAIVAQKTLENTREKIPDEKRGGVSILPVIPIFPMFFWGMALLIDYFADPVGTWIIGLFHALFAFVLVASIVRDWRRIRSLR